MADPRIVNIPVPLLASTVNIYVQYSPDDETWLNVKHDDTTAFEADPDNKVVTLDGVNAIPDDSTSNLRAATTPPMYYRYRFEYGDGNLTNWYPQLVIPSPEDFIYRLKLELKDPSLDGKRELLSNRDYRQRVAMAVTRFERFQPRHAAQVFDLTSNDQSYNLPDDWDLNFSRGRSCRLTIFSRMTPCCSGALPVSTPTAASRRGSITPRGMRGTVPRCRPRTSRACCSGRRATPPRNCSPRQISSGTFRLARK